MKNRAAPYLHITLSDNDFMTYHVALVAAIEELLKLVDYPKEEDLESLREPIAHIWTGLHLLWRALDHFPKDNPQTLLYYFKERMKLKIVDFSEIPDDDNHESIFIPLFEGAESFIR